MTVVFFILVSICGKWIGRNVPLRKFNWGDPLTHYIAAIHIERLGRNVGCLVAG